MPGVHPKPRVLHTSKIKKNDTVKVIAGGAKGKVGRVLEVDREKNRVVVEGAKMIKKHVKPNPQRQIKGGIAETPASIHISNVMLLDSKGDVTRIGIQRGDDGKRIRVAKSTGEVVDKK
jgi:large subunit ribosomal protein L24